MRKLRSVTALKRKMSRTRKLRHRIEHNGYRIEESERGHAQRAVDTGRWIYNWFENDDERRNLREKKIGHRSLGRDLTAGMFPTKITPDGVVVSMFPHWALLTRHGPARFTAIAILSVALVCIERDNGFQAEELEAVFTPSRTCPCYYPN
jgi:hypothetical protein